MAVTGSIVVTAPGKIILHGEHAVVYGKKAIACAIDGTIKIEMSSNRESDTVVIYMSDVGSKTFDEPMKVETKLLKNLYQQCLSLGNIVSNVMPWQDKIKKFAIPTFCLDEVEHKLVIVAMTTFLFGYFKILIYDGELPFPELSIKVSSNNLPVGAGLGSSAAYNVSVATALLLLAGKITSTKTNNGDFNIDDKSLSIINSAAYEMEKLVHGNPSGVDNSVSTFGGAVVYQGGKITRLAKFPQVMLLVVNTGISRNTKLLVSSVKSKMDKFPDVMEPIMNSMHRISETAQDIFSQISECDKDDQCSILHEKLEELVHINHHLLNSIGVGHPKLDEIYKLASECDYACKLTGAGGGGCAIILLGKNASDDDVAKLKCKLKESGFDSWGAILGCGGVKIIQSLNAADSL